MPDTTRPTPSDLLAQGHTPMMAQYSGVTF